MNSITTHVLDTSRGRPAAGVPVALEFLLVESGWEQIGMGETDADGRIKELLPPGHVLAEGMYRLNFDTTSYFAALGGESFYPEVTIVFAVRDAGQHYHVPLLLSPYGFSTYRGS